MHIKSCYLLPATCYLRAKFTLLLATCSLLPAPCYLQALLAQELPDSSHLSVYVFHDSKYVNAALSGKYAEQPFTEGLCNDIYSYVRSTLPDSLDDYSLDIRANGRNIYDLVPNFYRHDTSQDGSRLWRREYEGRPWVKNISTHVNAKDGLKNTHIALWQSHGRYFKNECDDWYWQRPRLFCTTEDLFSQTFVVPYLIPMLENAGAVVYTPRERDWQNHEVIVDNDNPRRHGRYFEEGTGSWHDCDSAGFAHNKTIYYSGENPFRDGTVRCIDTESKLRDVSSITWMPDIPEAGRYAVYVSYQTVDGSIDNAQYSVHHKGGITNFEVNQQMGGGTWVYLGSFEFSKGMSLSGCVELSNYSRKRGVVTADAVRFGGGMGNISRGSYGVSGLPRWAEAARYSLQWAGFEPEIYSVSGDSNDYRDDLWCRPNAINQLAGGSLFGGNHPGRNVPLELSLAFHTDAGYTSDDSSFVGSLAICTLQGASLGMHNDGVSRYISYDLASMMIHGLNDDLKSYDWTTRNIWTKNYCETREPEIPSVLLEMLSHQNFADMRLAMSPRFKFDFCRSIYKSIVKYIATTHSRKYVIQPLPVTEFYTTLDTSADEVQLYWTPVTDSLEPTAVADRYIVYTRSDDSGFDNGRLVTDTSCRIKIQRGHIYSFRVTALNKGGESFPSETLSAYISDDNDNDNEAKTYLTLVSPLSSLDSLSAPAVIATADSLGFDLSASKGHQYGPYPGFCGPQRVFDRTLIGLDAPYGLGSSGNELEGIILPGSTLDNIYPYAREVLKQHNHSFCSASQSAVLAGKITTPTETIKPIESMETIETIESIETIETIETIKP